MLSTLLIGKKLFNNPKLIKIIVYATSCILVSLIGAFLVIKLFFEPISPPQNIFISNLVDTSATISWATDKPARGAVMVSRENKFPILPILSSEIVRDDGEKSLLRMRFYTTHHVTIPNLTKNTKYYYRIYEGYHVVVEGEFTTGPSFDSLDTPAPVFGKVVEEDGKTPAIGKIVYLKILGRNKESSLISAITNIQGGWVIDLANLRDITGKEKYVVTKDDKANVVVEGGSKGRYKIETFVGSQKNWPLIILSKKDK